MNLELKQEHSWVNFSYKFSSITENEEYIEREDEFDVNPDDLKEFTPIKKSEFDDIADNSFSKLVRINEKSLPPIKSHLENDLMIKGQSIEEEENVKITEITDMKEENWLSLNCIRNFIF